MRGSHVEILNELALLSDEEIQNRLTTVGFDPDDYEELIRDRAHVYAGMRLATLLGMVGH